MARKRRLLILGPSFRRDKSDGVLPAVERYDGLFFRIVRKYLSIVRDVDVLVMRDDLVLVDSRAPLPYSPPEGEKWGSRSLSEDIIKKAGERNIVVFSEKLMKGRYLEIFVAMGKRYAKALPDLSQFDVKVIFPVGGGGQGPKARALKEWLSKGR